MDIFYESFITNVDPREFTSPYDEYADIINLFRLSYNNRPYKFTVKNGSNKLIEPIQVL